MKKSIIIDQSWVKDWSEGLMNQDQTNHLLEWFKTTPERMRGLLFNFPPMSLVRSTHALEVPYPGTLAIVASYTEDGHIGVRQEPSADVVLVKPTDIAVVHCWKGLTPLRVLQLLNSSPVQLNA